jgi:hypothetical protein
MPETMLEKLLGRTFDVGYCENCNIFIPVKLGKLMITCRICGNILEFAIIKVKTIIPPGDNPELDCEKCMDYGLCDHERPKKSCFNPKGG